MNFALYRLPYDDTYTEIHSDRPAECLPSLCCIGKESGFVIAPFDCSCKDTPIVRICPDKVEKKSVDEDEALHRGGFVKSRDMSVAYADDFRRFHDAVASGRFGKLVLSRTRETAYDAPDLRRLFIDACRRYPRLAVMLVSTPVTGTWLVATPEKLLTGDGTWWKTMALAGTMPYAEGFQEWSRKNQQEQHFVETYIEKCIDVFGCDIIKDGPFTRRAGNLVHLCTDFRFHLTEGSVIGDVLTALHPTPAVCGLPKDEAFMFIKNNEHAPRLYYSGFMGPVGIDGKTDIYVSLRCARLDNGKATLYAGGGIMPESMVESEWEETENKMQTIGDVLK